MSQMWMEVSRSTACQWRCCSDNKVPEMWKLLLNSYKVKMHQFTAIKVFISKTAYNQIKDSVTKAQSDFEVGGVLLGHKTFGRYFVVAVTAPTEIAEKSKVSFTLDGDWHTTRASKLMQKFQHKPSILGIWHSHICDIDVFSEQDRQSNKQLAILLNGTLSMIATLSMPLQETKLTTYFITASGKECICQVEIDLYDRAIPKRYLNFTRRDNNEWK